MRGRREGCGVHPSTPPRGAWGGPTRAGACPQDMPTTPTPTLKPRTAMCRTLRMVGWTVGGVTDIGGLEFHQRDVGDLHIEVSKTVGSTIRLGDYRCIRDFAVTRETCLEVTGGHPQRHTAHEYPRCLRLCRCGSSPIVGLHTHGGGVLGGVPQERPRCILVDDNVYYPHSACAHCIAPKRKLSNTPLFRSNQPTIIVC